MEWENNDGRTMNKGGLHVTIANYLLKFRSFFAHGQSNRIKSNNSGDDAALLLCFRFDLQFTSLSRLNPMSVSGEPA